jgi:hypothetical protein
MFKYIQSLFHRAHEVAVVIYVSKFSFEFVSSLPIS